MKILLITILFVTTLLSYNQTSARYIDSVLPNCHNHEDVQTTISWSPNNRWLIVGGKNGVHLYTASFDYIRSIYTSGDNFVYSVDWDSSGNKLAILYADGKVLITNVEVEDTDVYWDTELASVVMLDWSPNDRLILVSSRRGNIASYNTDTNESTQLELDEEYRSIEGISWSFDNRFIAFYAVDKIIVWDMEENKLYKSLRVASHLIPYWYQNSYDLILGGSIPNNLTIDFPNYFAIFTWHIENQQIDINTTLQYEQFEEYYSVTQFYSLKLHPNGDIISGYAFNNQIYIWRFSDKNFFIEFPALPRGEWFEFPAYNSLAWSPDGRFLGNVGADGQACIWDMSSLE